MDADTVAGIITLSGAVVGFAVWVVKWKIEKVKLKSENSLLKEELKDASASVQISLEALNSIKDSVARMFRDSAADRFLILAARNGKSTPNRTTAVYEQHKSTGLSMISIGATHRYVDFQIDDDYRRLLKRAENDGQVFLKTDNLQDSALKDIYMYEEVEASSIHFLMRTKIDDNSDRIWYCSVATHNPAGFSSKCKTMIKSHVGSIRRQVQSFI